MNYNGNSYPQNSYQRYEQANSLADYTRRVFSWMFIGLAITFAIGFFIMLNKDVAIKFLSKNIGAYYVVALVEVVMVFALGFFVSKLSPVVCKVIFLFYSVLNGITIAPALITCGYTSAFYAFAATSLIFGAMSLYGMATKKDLTKLGPILFIGLIGLIIYSIIAMLFHMPMSDLVISIIGIVIFVGFTAYDTQKIKRYYSEFSGDQVSLQKTAIIAALDLYLDFINLFLYILRLFARNND